MKFLIGCWTFLDADKPSQMRAHWLDLNGVGALSEIADAPKSVYYGAVEPGGQSMLLLRNDMHRSAMSRQTIHADGILTETGHWRCGENGVDEGGSYIAFDQTGAYFAVANSAVGWVIYRNGATPEAIADLCHEGSGPHPRQAHSHPHCVIFSPDNRWIYAADMGADAVLAFPFDAATGRVGEKIIAHRTTPGAGPRHLLFHHGLVYLLNELGNALEVLAPNADGTLTALQKVATMPEDFTAFTHCSHLAVGTQENVILAANRGHDSIAGFILGDDGRVIERLWTPSGGVWPWCFAVASDGRLIVANTRSDTLSIFAPDGPGRFRLIQNLNVEKPAFIMAV